VVPNWPKPLSQLPGHENWTWGAVQGVFAESPDRVFMLERGELPAMQRPQPKAFPEMGPSLSFPVGQAPFRNASQGMVASPPGAGGPGADPDDPKQAWQGRMGIDARWEHTIVVFNSAGDIVEQWTQWDKMMRRPHSVYINPYDPEKYVWIVDDHSNAVFKFTHDGKTLVQTIGTPNQKGADDKHFNRPTFLTWLPDSTMFVADGYNGTRVVKFDKDGTFVTAWGRAEWPRPVQRGARHRRGSDDAARLRERPRQQADAGVRRERQVPRSVAILTRVEHAVPDRRLRSLGHLGVRGRHAKVVKYDFDGHYLYSWGTLGDHAGGFFNMHGASTDQQGNLYIAEVGNGRLQKFRPRANANKALLVGAPVYAAWR